MVSNRTFDWTVVGALVVGVWRGNCCVTMAKIRTGICMDRRVLAFLGLMVLVGAGLVFWRAQRLALRRLELPLVSDSVESGGEPEMDLARLLVGEGRVETSMDGESWEEIESEAVVEMGAWLLTGEETRAAVVFADGSVMKLDSQTQVQIRNVEFDGQKLSADVFQLFGNTWHRVRKLLDAHNDYSVETPTTVATVRGTVFSVGVEQGLTEVVVVESQVEVGLIDDDLPEDKRWFASKLLLPGEVMQVDEKVVEKGKSIGVEAMVVRPVSESLRHKAWMVENVVEDENLDKVELETDGSSLQMLEVYRKFYLASEKESEPVVKDSVAEPKLELLKDDYVMVSSPSPTPKPSLEPSATPALRVDSVKGVTDSVKVVEVEEDLVSDPVLLNNQVRVDTDSLLLVTPKPTPAATLKPVYELFGW